MRRCVQLLTGSVHVLHMLRRKHLPPPQIYVIDSADRKRFEETGQVSLHVTKKHTSIPETKLLLHGSCWMCVTGACRVVG